MSTAYSPVTALTGATIDTPTHPSLRTLPELLAIDAVEPDQPVILWTEEQLSVDGTIKVHDNPSCPSVRGALERHAYRTQDVLVVLANPGYRKCLCTRRHKIPGDQDECSTGPLFTCTRTDAETLTWLAENAVTRRRLDNEPYPPTQMAAHTAAHLGAAIPHSGLRDLNERVADRRRVLRAHRTEAMASPEYQQARNLRVLSGARSWYAARILDGYPGYLRRLRDLTTGLEIGVNPDVCTDLLQANAPRSAAAVVAQMPMPQVWVTPIGSAKYGAESVWAWATDVLLPADAAVGQDALALVPVSLLFSLPANRATYQPLCLDDGYTAETVRTAQILADHRDQVAELVKAVQAASS